MREIFSVFVIFFEESEENEFGKQHGTFRMGKGLAAAAGPERIGFQTVLRLYAGVGTD